MRTASSSHRPLMLAGVAALLLLAFCFRATVRGDGVGYYAYLPALVAHQTYDMAPTFERFLESDVPIEARNLEHRLPNGMTANYKPVGTALLALPFYAATHLVMLILPGPQDPTLGAEYQLAFTAASLFYLLIALLLLYRFVRELFGPRPAALAVAAVTFATPLSAYAFFETGYYHTFSVFVITAFGLLLYRTHGHRRPWQWFAAGALGGLATITHVNEVLFLALVPLESIWLLIRHRWSPDRIGGYAAFAGGAFLGGLPQLITDRVIFGQWLPVAAPNITFDFGHPHLLELLVSTHNGWLPWSPIVVLAVCGLPMAVRRLGWFAAALIVVGLGEILLNASLSDWYGGLGFGARRLTDQTLILAVGLGGVFAWLGARLRAWIPAAITAVFIAWNTLLLAQFYYVLGPNLGPSWADFLVTNQLRALAFVPHLFVQGTVVRDAAVGEWAIALGVWLALAGVVAGAWGLGARHPVTAGALPAQAPDRRTRP
ncbi:MAG TPA: glycosyltransferase family 39 protein [Candidatus Limnocylindrales bacterium]|nr:glycosyltransferase family 39 protein [Candidatus Limnocylindrales bacterium]